MKNKPLPTPLIRQLIWLFWIVIPAGNIYAQELVLLNSPAIFTGQSSQAEPGQRTLKEVFADLEKQFSISIIYEESVVAGKSVAYKIAPAAKIDQALQEILNPVKLQFRKIGKDVYAIIPARHMEPGLPARPSEKTIPPVSNMLLPALQQLPAVPVFTISGRVTAQENGEGMPGVNVLLKGSSTGTTTNGEGNYTLSVPDAAANGTLIFSYIGYTTEEVAINNQNVINVSLVADIKSLSEVVVVGYGTQKRSDITGSIASINNEEIRNIPATSLDQYLQGKAAGVQVTQASAAPGGGLNVRIRGGSSITAGIEPLYVVDGFPIYNNNSDFIGRRPTGAGQAPNALSIINPNDIESIEILKDASATAIYGARGANGVVIITTKRGKAGQNKIEVESYYGIQTIQRKVDLLNAREYAQLINEVRLNDNPNAAPAFNVDTIQTNTDWQDLLFRPAPIQNHQLSLSGGNDNTRYLLAGNFFRQDGIVRGSDFTRLSLRINLDKKFNDRFTVGNNLTVSRSNNNIVISDVEGGAVSNAQRMAPFIPAYDEFGNYTNNDFGRYPSVNGNLNSPLYLAEAVTNQNVGTRILGNVFADYKIVEGLIFRTSAGADVSFVKDNYFAPVNINRNAIQNNATINAISLTQWINENQLTYARTFAEKHRLDATAVFSLQEQKREFVGAQSFDVPSDRVGLNDLNASQTNSAQNRTFSSAADWSMVSYTWRINYNYAGKYFLTATVRRDGSSRFGANNKYGTFPSMAAAWTVSQENFLQSQTLLSNLKLRASVGRTGNAEIPSYQSIGVLGTQQYIFNNITYTGYSPSRLPNPDLQWETTTQFDAGLDIGLLRDRVSMTVDYFIKKTDNMLYDVDVPTTSGFNSFVTNIGNLENRGFEISLNTINTDGPFRWTTNFNMSQVRNRVLSLGETSQVISGNVLLRTGESLGIFFGYQTNGIFQNQEEINNSAQRPGNPLQARLGDVRYVDTDGNGIINADDRVILGGGMPDFFGGLTNTFSYKGFDLSIFFNAVIGYEIYNANTQQLLNLNGNFNQMKIANERWTPENPGNTVPRATSSGAGVNNQFSDRFIEDGSFVRLRNASLGYNFPSAWLKGVNLQNLRVYVTAQNFLTFTRYSGYDPEVSSTGNNQINFSTDRGAYPSARTILFGINLGL
jgi:TonB-dependent starch-binding outer membrane protein SusC